MAYRYYAVFRGRETGVFTTWESCRQQVDGFSNSIYKGFSRYEDAEKFVKYGPHSETQFESSGTFTERLTHG